jgi:5-hydroxyisourate hydrolase-like protein (transthyretin family)
MNRNIIFSIAFFCISGLTACKKNLVPDLKPVDVNVNIAYSAASKLPLQNLTVSIKNLETGLVEYATTDQDGKAVFKEISSGTYDISVKREFTATEYLSLTGEQEPTKVVFNAGETNYKIKTNNGNYQLNMTQWMRFFL